MRLVTAGVALLVLGITFGILNAQTAQPRIEESIVKVLNSEGTGGGTGFVTTSLNRKVIVTNDHVCAVAEGGYARIETDDGRVLLKKVLRTSPVRDLCLLEGADVPALRIASRGPKRFEQLTSYGHPGLRPTAPASGVYTGNDIIQIGGEKPPTGCPLGSVEVQTLFGEYCVLTMEISYSTIFAAPGSSGSPVVNQNGEVVGVINSTNGQGFQGMFIPLNYLRDILDEQN